MPWASVGLERLSGQSWWASLRCRRPGKATMVWRVEGVVTYVLQICISLGNWPDSGLRTSLLGESRQFCNIPPSSQTFVAWQPAPPKKKKQTNPTHKHWIQRWVLVVATGVCSVVFCLVGWRTFILITWSSSDARLHLSQPSLDVRVWELAAWILSVCLCFPCSNTTAFMGTATNTTSFADFLCGAGVQRFFLTQKSKMTHAVIKGLCLVCEPAV